MYIRWYKYRSIDLAETATAPSGMASKADALYAEATSLVPKRKANGPIDDLAMKERETCRGQPVA